MTELERLNTELVTSVNGINPHVLFYVDISVPVIIKKNTLLDSCNLLPK